MKPQWTVYLLPITVGCIGIVLCVLVLSNRSQQPTLLVPTVSTPQCAHWSIFRTAQLLGIPSALGEIQRLLPNQPQGHTMAQVAETLVKIGLKVEGYRHDWDSLSQQDFPCIVHLAKPDHYIVVSGMEPERSYVHIFDDGGNRTRWRRETFEQRWTGYTLHIQKDSDFVTVKANELKPCAVFDHLILDKGDIPAIGEPVEFVFPIHNFGSADLIVEDVKVNCGCLKSEKPDAPIRPGESGAIKLFYSIEPKRGVFTETAAVRTNCPDNPVVVISACGFTGVEVRIEPSRIVLDRLFVGRQSTYRSFVRYTGEWNDFDVKLELTDYKDYRIEFALIRLLYFFDRFRNEHPFSLWNINPKLYFCRSVQRNQPWTRLTFLHYNCLALPRLYGLDIGLKLPNNIHQNLRIFPRKNLLLSINSRDRDSPNHQYKKRKH